MAKNTPSAHAPPEAVISIIGAGMSIEGDSETDGSLRVEGTIRGNVKAGKSVVVGRDGLVDGSIYTQDAVIAGRVSGGIYAVSRLELQATSEVSGEIEAPRMQVEEGAKVQGQIAVGESFVDAASQAAQPGSADGGGEGEPDTEPESAKPEDSEDLEESEDSENEEESEDSENEEESESSSETENSEDPDDSENLAASESLAKSEVEMLGESEELELLAELEELERLEEPERSEKGEELSHG